MKKLNILLAAAAVVSLAACDDKSDLGIAQTNPQENIMAANGLEVAYPETLAGTAINLDAYQDQMIPVINIVKTDDLPEGATVDFRMEVSSDANFSTYKTLNVVDGAVAANDWENAYLEMVGKSPLPTQQWIRFEAYAHTDADLVRFGGQDFYYAAKELTVTPYDLRLPIENTYYFQLGDAAPVEMSHSARHPYDDPNFTYLFEVSADQAANGLTWKIFPASALNTDNFIGVSDTGERDDMNGSLMIGGESGLITQAGTLKITANILDMTYGISYAFDYIYTPGPANGWGFENNMLLYTSDYEKYHGFVYVQEQFKLCGQAGWSPLNWGSSDGVNLTQDGPNLKVEADGLYWVDVNLGDLTYALTHVEKMGMIGANGNWNDDVDMTSDDFKTWTGELVAEGATSFKFRVNSAWAINLGGDVNDLQLNGANIDIAEAGTYAITLNLGTLPYSCTVVKK